MSRSKVFAFPIQRTRYLTTLFFDRQTQDINNIPLYSMGKGSENPRNGNGETTTAATSIQELATSSDNYNGDDDDDDIIDNDITVSDEDLLLACRSYLQKKNRLGQWTAFEARRKSRQHQQQRSQASQSGFFWDDPSELKYFRQQTHMITPGNINTNYNNNDDDMDLDEDDEEDPMMMHDNSGNDNDEDIIRYISAAAVSETYYVPEPTSKIEQITFDFKGEQPEQNDNDDSDDATAAEESSPLELWARHFSTFPMQPSKSQRNRSNAVKKRWEDPEWKARWYERRWGKLSSSSSDSTDENTIKDDGKENEGTASSSNRNSENGSHSASTSIKKNWKQGAKTSALTPDFLASDVFNSLTEEEIRRAVEMYLQSNKKRTDTRKRTQEVRRKSLLMSAPTTASNITAKVPPNALAWDRDPQALEEARRIRSERAKKSYQTRLKNNNQRSKQRATKTSAAATTAVTQTRKNPTESAPKDALSRIASDLDKSRLPQLQDLKLIAGPAKLPKRKKLLIRLISEYFGLRGKCVPVGNEDDSETLQFITNCSVSQLIAFALDKVREAHGKSAT